MPLSTHAFKHHMKAMGQFYQGAPSHSYSLPISLIASPIGHQHLVTTFGTSRNGTPPLAPLLSSIESSLSDAFNQQQTAANKTVQSLSSGAVMPQVIQALSEQKASAKVSINHVIDASYEQLTNYGVANPHTQAEILKLSSQLGDFITHLLSSMGGYFDQLSADIVHWSQTVIVESAWSSITSWFTGAAHRIAHFFQQIGAAIESAFETLEAAAKAAWNEAKKLIEKAIEAGEKAILEPIAKAAIKGLPIAELRQAWSVISSENAHHIAQIKTDVMNKQTSPASRASMQAIAREMEPHLTHANMRSQAGLDTVSKDLESFSQSVPSYLSFGVEFQATAAVGLGAEGAIGMLSGIPNVTDVVGYGSVGASVGEQIGAEADAALVLKAAAPENTGGVYVGLIFSLEAEVGGTVQVTFSFPSLEFSGVSIGIGAGVEEAIAIDGGYTWVF